jgi:hypothetical protein
VAAANRAGLGPVNSSGAHVAPQVRGCCGDVVVDGALHLCDVTCDVIYILLYHIWLHRCASVEHNVVDEGRCWVLTCSFM